MKTLRIYLDTSVLGGCFDAEFAAWSTGLMEDFRAPVHSRALRPACRGDRTRTWACPNLHRELLGLALQQSVEVSPEALALLAAYEGHSVLGPKYRSDMLHIALATVADADILVSWNFKHIVRFDKIRLFNAANLEQGYKSLPIHSPREVTTYGRSSDQSG
jgi:hypothetical protein